MERRGCVDDRLQAVNLDCLIEGSGDGDVRNNSKVELAARGVWVCFSDFGCLLFGPYSCDDGMAMCKQNVENMSGDEPASTWVSCVLVFERQCINGWEVTRILGLGQSYQ